MAEMRTQGPTVTSHVDPLPEPVTFTGNVAQRLSTIAARVRERAVATRTFNAEVAADVEELARLASIIAEATAAVHSMSDQLADMMRR